MKALHRWARRHFAALSWAAIVAAVALTVGLGFVGFSESAATRELPASTRLYVAVQLLTLESGATEAFEQAPVPRSLQLARWTGVAASLGAILNALLALFARRIHDARLRRLSGHSVVIGAGEAGTELATNLLDDGERVAVIEADAGHAALPALVDRGAWDRLGDATEPETLRAAAVQQADRVIVVGGSDTTNLEILSAIHEVCGDRDPRQPPLTCHVHLARPHFERLADPLSGRESDTPRLEVSTFSRPANSARLLLEEAPLDREPIAEGDERQVHLVIAELSPVGEALLRQALAIGHYANGVPLAVTVIDPSATRKQQALQARMPELHECADLVFLDGDPDQAAIRERIAGLLEDPGQLVSVAVCGADAEAALSTCLDLLPLLTDHNHTIFVNLAGDPRVARLLQAAPVGPARLVPFGNATAACSATAVLCGELDTLARKIHDAYRAKRIQEGDLVEKYPALRPWSELSGDLRDANRQQADHIPVKLRALGYAMRPAEDGAPGIAFQPSDEEVEALARAEHRRWCANRRLAGYRHGPVRDDAARIHPDLVPWEALDERTRDYDRDPVRNLPELLATVGYRIQRVG